MEVTAKGQRSFIEKWPARIKFHPPKIATTIFRLRVTGLISCAGTAHRAITAIYPEAPAWPTDEYRKATIIIPKERNHGSIPY